MFDPELFDSAIFDVELELGKLVRPRRRRKYGHSDYGTWKLGSKR